MKKIFLAALIAASSVSFSFGDCIQNCQKAINDPKSQNDCIAQCSAFNFNENELEKKTLCKNNCNAKYLNDGI